MTTQTTFDPRRMKLVYDYAADRYLKSLPPEHFMEAMPQATQRKITLASFDLIQVSRPDIQCFNELLVQYPQSAEDLDKPGQVVPDNMVVVHPTPLEVTTNFATLLQPVGPFLVLEYVSKHSERKDYDISYTKYEQGLKVPYYLIFYPDADELTVFRLSAKGYLSIPPDEFDRIAIPELELEVGLRDGWVRYWFRGDLLPLSGDLLRQFNAARTRLVVTEGRLAAAEGQLTAAKDVLTVTQDRLTVSESQLVAKQSELATAKAQAEAERQTRLEMEAELARLREELTREKPPGA